MPTLTRTELANAAGCNAEAVRHFERTGLLREPPRSGGGHRRYGARDVERLKLILSARRLGMPVGDLARLLALVDRRRTLPDGVETATLEVGALIGRRLEDLERLVRTIEDLNRSPH